MFNTGFLSLFSPQIDEKMKRDTKDDVDEAREFANIPVEVFEAICAAFPDQGATVDELKDKWVK